MFLKDEKETISYGLKFADKMTENTVLFLNGNLGAGKTTFTKGVVKGLKGRENDVSSPTYTYVQEYDTLDGKLVTHIDLYRSKKGDFDDELYSIVTECLNPIIIEWPENIGEHLTKYISDSKNLIKIDINITKSGERDFIIQSNE